ncbi:MAG: hypothetical protein QOE99_2134, partial [Actinomycetota bacterium]|nr:hypothetical protein [Actinomycetota bacterium]
MTTADLRERLDGVMLRDRQRIERRLAGRPDLARLSREVD